MNIVVFGAAGKAGSRIINEAAGRGHHVTAVAKRVEQLKNVPAGVVIKTGDVTLASSLREFAPGSDVFVVAIGGENDTWRRAAQALAENLSQLPNAPRVLHMGGGSTLLAPDGKRFFDSPGFPPQFLGPAKGQSEALDFYRSLPPGLRWTYLSPPPVNFAPGIRKGHYRTGTEQPVTDEQGESKISYEDFAMAMIDEIEHPKFLNQRFTVGY